MPDPKNVVNPDLVDVADQAFNGLPTQVPSIGSTPASASENNFFGRGGHRPVVVDQEILVSPSTNAGAVVDGDDPSQVKPVASAVNQPVTVGPAQTAGTNVNGGTFSPQSVNTQQTTQNNVVGQVYGSGTPINVNV